MKNTNSQNETIINFDLYKYTITNKISKNIKDIVNLTDNFLDLYKKIRHTSDIVQKKEDRQTTYEYMKIIHNLFSDIENSLRDYEIKAKQQNLKLKKEELPKFIDYIEMSEEEYKKFKKENDINEQRMLIWLELFKRKIQYLTKVILKDIKDNYEVNDKITLINQFYRQIFVAYRIILNDFFMLGSPENKIKIKKK